MRSHICFLTLFISASLFAAAESGEADLRRASRTSKTAAPSTIHSANNSRAIPGHPGDYQVCETCGCAPCECVDTLPYGFAIHRIIHRIGFKKDQSIIHRVGFKKDQSIIHRVGFKKDQFAGLWAPEGDTCSGGGDDGRVCTPMSILASGARGLDNLVNFRFCHDPYDDPCSPTGGWHKCGHSSRCVPGCDEPVVGPCWYTAPKHCTLFGKVPLHPPHCSKFGNGPGGPENCCIDVDQGASTPAPEVLEPPQTTQASVIRPARPQPKLRPAPRRPIAVQTQHSVAGPDRSATEAEKLHRVTALCTRTVQRTSHSQPLPADNGAASAGRKPTEPDLLIRLQTPQNEELRFSRPADDGRGRARFAEAE